MKFLVVSDSHGRDDDVKGVMEQVKDFDMLIHCGDVEGGEDYIRALTDKPVIMVAGNNDFRSDLPSQELIEVEGYRIFIAHGHQFYVNFGVGNLEEFCRKNDIQVAMFGHTHKPYLQIEDDLTILNPGSISYPRQSDRKQTFLIMEIDSNGEAHYSHGVYKEGNHKGFFW
ncbi:MAG: metallophosphoesterase [Clostridiales bacterium]|nr:metallophosphoesterase [Clostridiales bacterium]